MGLFQILWEYHEAFLAGLAETLRLCAVIWSVGLIFGGFLGILAVRFPRGIGIPARIFSFILSGLPILVLLFWLHYPLQAALGIVIDPFITASAAIGCVNIFAVAEIIRAAIDGLPSQYVEAAKVCGISQTRILWRIEIPLVARFALPSLLQTQVNMLQLTLFASLISVDELFRTAQRINAMIYRPIEIYTALGCFFLLVCLPLNGMALWLKAKYLRDLSEK